MRDWFVKQYHDIKGNIKYGLLATLWPLIVWIAKKMLQHIPNISPLMVWAILLCLSLAAFLWLTKSFKIPVPPVATPTPVSASVPAPVTVQPAQQLKPSFPTISALYKRIPDISRAGIDEYFRAAHHSPVTAEVENNIKTAVRDLSSSDREELYSRLIGVGLVSYHYDQTWWAIFKSQLVLLTEMNRRNGWISLREAKSFYDNAALACPLVYPKYTFESWLNYLKGERLLLHHPADVSHTEDMLEISYEGKDFLKYLAHWGRNINVKNC
jgi:hypothetical protein